MTDLGIAKVLVGAAANFGQTGEVAERFVVPEVRRVVCSCSELVEQRRPLVSHSIVLMSAF